MFFDFFLLQIFNFLNSCTHPPTPTQWHTSQLTEDTNVLLPCLQKKKNMNAKKIKFCVIEIFPIFFISRCFPRRIGFVHGYYKKVVVNLKPSTYILNPLTNASFLRF